MKQNFNMLQARSIGDILGDTFTYIRVYYKSLAKMIVVYVLAPLMIGSIIFSTSMGKMMSSTMAGLQDQPDPTDFIGTGLEFFAGFIFLIVAYFLLAGVIYQHIYYAEKGEIPESVSEFSEGMFSKLLRFVPFAILVTIAISTIIVLAAFAAIEITGFLTLLFIPLIIYLLVKLILFPISFFVEDAGGFNSLARSWELTGGYFWNTLGVYLLISIVFGILSQLLSTPLFVVTAIAGAGFGTESGILEILVVFTYTLSFVFQVLFFAAQSIALGLHYFNLEERKEGQSLSEQVAGLEDDTA